MGPSTVPVFQQSQAPAAQPTRADPAIEKAKQDELRRMQGERGRAATVIVGKKAYGASDSLIPAGPGGGASVLGA